MRTGDFTTFFQAIDHPEDVYFYTDGDPQLAADPSDWGTVPEVDYSDQIEPLEEPVAGSDAWKMPAGLDPATARFPDAMDLAPGLKRFSFRLEPSQDETVVTVHRQPNSQVRGRARTVTMMRATPSPGSVPGARPPGTVPAPAAVSEAYATEKMVHAARGNVAFGLPGIVKQVTQGQAFTPAAAEAAIRAELHILLPGTFFTPAAGGGIVCPGGPVGNPIVYRFLMAAVNELHAQAIGFIGRA